MVNWSVRTSKHHPHLNLTLSSADLLHVYGSTSFRLKPAAEKYQRNPRFLQASTASAYTLGSWAPDSPGSKLSPSFRWSESSPGWSPGSAGSTGTEAQWPLRRILQTATEAGEHHAGPQALLNAFAFPLKIPFSHSRHKIKTRYWRTLHKLI